MIWNLQSQVFVLSNIVSKEADMRSTLVALTLTALSVIWGPTASALAQDAKVAKGTITAIGGRSLTVKVGDQDMAFNVDTKTIVQARGASTKATRFAATGKPGPHLADVLQPGPGGRGHLQRHGGQPSRVGDQGDSEGGRRGRAGGDARGRRREVDRRRLDHDQRQERRRRVVRADLQGRSEDDGLRQGRQHRGGGQGRQGAVRRTSWRAATTSPSRITSWATRCSPPTCTSR